MGTVYSTCFVHKRVSDLGASVLYTVPDGYVAVVRDIILYVDYDQSGGLIGISSLPESGSDQYVYLALQLTAVPGTLYHEDLHQVCGPGVQLLAVNGVSEFNCRISGYLLTL